MKNEGKEWQQHHPCQGFVVQVSIFLENQSCHIHQHFEEMLDLTFSGYISASFAQHGRTFLFKEEYTWLSLQTLVTSSISLNNTRTKTQTLQPHTQLKSALLKKSKTQGKQQTPLSPYTPHAFAEERFPSGAEKCVNEKRTKPKNPSRPPSPCQPV